MLRVHRAVLGMLCCPLFFASSGIKNKYKQKSFCFMFIICYQFIIVIISLSFSYTHTCSLFFLGSIITFSWFLQNIKEHHTIVTVSWSFIASLYLLKTNHKEECTMLENDHKQFLCYRFMADKRRMNVSLTRAKYSLYIIGHLQSLKVCEKFFK